MRGVTIAILISTGTALLLAAFFAFLGVPAFNQDRFKAKSYWKTTCNVTDCIPHTPEYSIITIDTHHYFDAWISITVKNGCQRYPIGSIIECYVRSNDLRIDKPGGNTGLTLVIISGVFAFIAVGLVTAWFGYSSVVKIYSKCTNTSAYSAQASDVEMNSDKEDA